MWRFFEQVAAIGQTLLGAFLLFLLACTLAGVLIIAFGGEVPFYRP